MSSDVLEGAEQGTPFADEVGEEKVPLGDQVEKHSAVVETKVPAPVSREPRVFTTSGALRLVNAAPRTPEQKVQSQESPPAAGQMTVEALKAICVTHPSMYSTAALNEVAYLSAHEFTTVDNLDTVFPELSTLFLEKNCIEDTSRIALQAPAVGSLYLAHNFVSSLSLRGMCRLVTLDLSYNRLRSLEGVQYCPFLRTLNVSHNRLTSIAPLRGMRHLQCLDIRNNNIQLQEKQTGPLMFAVYASLDATPCCWALQESATDPEQQTSEPKDENITQGTGEDTNEQNQERANDQTLPEPSNPGESTDDSDDEFAWIGQLGMGYGPVRRCGLKKLKRSGGSLGGSITSEQPQDTENASNGDEDVKEDGVGGTHPDKASGDNDAVGGSHAGGVSANAEKTGGDDADDSPHSTNDTHRSQESGDTDGMADDTTSGATAETVPELEDADDAEPVVCANWSHLPAVLAYVHQMATEHARTGKDNDTHADKDGDGSVDEQKVTCRVKPQPNALFSFDGPVDVSHRMQWDGVESPTAKKAPSIVLTGTMLTLACHFPQLRCLYASHNPFVKRTKHMLRTLVTFNPRLSFVETSPVRELDRIKWTAWYRGGMPAARLASEAFLAQSKRRHRRHIKTSVMASQKRRLGRLAREQYSGIIEPGSTAQSSTAEAPVTRSMQVVYRPTVHRSVVHYMLAHGVAEEDMVVVDDHSLVDDGVRKGTGLKLVPVDDSHTGTEGITVTELDNQADWTGEENASTDQKNLSPPDGTAQTEDQTDVATEDAAGWDEETIVSPTPSPSKPIRAEDVDISEGLV